MVLIWVTFSYFPRIWASVLKTGSSSFSHIHASNKIPGPIIFQPLNLSFSNLFSRRHQVIIARRFFIHVLIHSLHLAFYWVLVTCTNTENTKVIKKEIFVFWFWLHWVFVVACGLSCSMACGILVPRPGMEPVSLALEAGFLTTGPPRKSPD